MPGLIGDRAVVLGAGMGGLLAARVLADFYRTVAVVERDVLPDKPLQRRGIPQGKHAHALLGRGSRILGELFPGFFDELVADGALVWDDGDLSRFWTLVGGHLMLRHGRIANPASMANYWSSRPLLEWRVRQRLSAIPNVGFRDGHDVLGLVSTPLGDQVTGIRIAESSRGGDGESTLTADLVVDATGRGSRTPVFLEKLGYNRPREDEVTVEVSYASMRVRIPAEAIRELAVAVYPVPARPTSFVLVRCENDSYLIGAAMMAGQEPPADGNALLEFARATAPAHVRQALSAAEPLEKVAHHRIPSYKWRRYDLLRRLPKGLLAFGDAICSFNPIYGQGMTIAAIEALVLRDSLHGGATALAQRFYRTCTKDIRVAWRTAVGSDLALPQIQGRRPMSMRITNAYMDYVLAVAETDPLVTEQFVRVIWMLDSPQRLIRPLILLRVLRSMLRGP